MHFDDVLLEKYLLAAKSFFLHCILPELLSKWYSRQHSIAVPTIDTDSRPADDDDGSWCYCKEDNAGEMIACDNKTCPNKWYHLACLKMMTIPKGKWLCPTCHASSYNLKHTTKNTNPSQASKRAKKCCLMISC